MAKAKEILGVDCGGLAAGAVPLVLERSLVEMCVLRTRALDFSDPEGVHDMRVSSRRLRSALRDFAPLLKKTKLSSSVRQLKEIAASLGAVRDHDVAIIALEKLQTKATPEISAGLQRIIDDHKSSRETARKDLRQAISIKTLSRLKPAFTEALESGALSTDGKRTKPETTKKGGTYKVFARSTLLKGLKQLEALSTSLYEPEKVEPLHEMRIAAKRLRYALELFANCWGDSLGEFARQVAQLQSSLGELHDCDIWIDHFGKRLRRVKVKIGEQTTPQDERDAMIWLLSHFSRLRTKHYRAALARWHEWETKDFCNRLSATLRT
jgi:CHAD domain-containing protein